jgi:hypothetical protein
MQQQQQQLLVSGLPQHPKSLECCWNLKIALLVQKAEKKLPATVPGLQHNFQLLQQQQQQQHRLSYSLTAPTATAAETQARLQVCSQLLRQQQGQLQLLLPRSLSLLLLSGLVSQPAWQLHCE